MGGLFDECSFCLMQVWPWVPESEGFRQQCQDMPVKSAERMQTKTIQRVSERAAERVWERVNAFYINRFLSV